MLTSPTRNVDATTAYCFFVRALRVVGAVAEVPIANLVPVAAVALILRDDLGLLRLYEADEGAKRVADVRTHPHECLSKLRHGRLVRHGAVVAQFHGAVASLGMSCVAGEAIAFLLIVGGRLAVAFPRLPEGSFLVADVFDCALGVAKGLLGVLHVVHRSDWPGSPAPISTRQSSTTT